MRGQRGETGKNGHNGSRKAKFPTATSVLNIPISPIRSLPVSPLSTIGERMREFTGRRAIGISGIAIVKMKSAHLGNHQGPRRVFHPSHRRRFPPHANHSRHVRTQCILLGLPVPQRRRRQWKIRFRYPSRNPCECRANPCSGR